TYPVSARPRRGSSMSKACAVSILVRAARANTNWPAARSAQESAPTPSTGVRARPDFASIHPSAAASTHHETIQSTARQRTGERSEPTRASSSLEHLEALTRDGIVRSQHEHLLVLLASTWQLALPAVVGVLVSEHDIGRVLGQLSLEQGKDNRR